MSSAGFALSRNSTDEGGHSGNGGCSICQESYHFMLDIAADLLVIGDEKVRQSVPLVKDVKSLYEIAEKRAVVPGKRKEMRGLDALSFKENQTTKLREKKYKSRSYAQKRRLEIHELFVLAGIEKEGVYLWTDRISNLFPNYERLESKSFGYSCSQKQCVIRYPTPYSKFRFEYAHESSPEDGLCKYYSLGKGLGSAKIYYSNVSANELDGEGNFLRSFTQNSITIGPNKEPYKIYEWVRCENTVPKLNSE